MPALPSDIRAQGVPSVVECIHSDNGGECSDGAFKQLCADCGLRQVFTTTDTEKLDGVEERELGLNKGAARAACLEVPSLFPDL